MASQPNQQSQPNQGYSQQSQPIQQQYVNQPQQQYHSQTQRYQQTTSNPQSQQYPQQYTQQQNYQQSGQQMINQQIPIQQMSQPMTKQTIPSKIIHQQMQIPGPTTIPASGQQYQEVVYVEDQPQNTNLPLQKQSTPKTQETIKILNKNNQTFIIILCICLSLNLIFCIIDISYSSSGLTEFASYNYYYDYLYSFGWEESADANDDWSDASYEELDDLFETNISTAGEFFAASMVLGIMLFIFIGGLIFFQINNYKTFDQMCKLEFEFKYFLLGIFGIFWLLHLISLISFQSEADTVCEEFAEWLDDSYSISDYECSLLSGMYIGYANTVIMVITFVILYKILPTTSFINIKANEFEQQGLINIQEEQEFVVVTETVTTENVPLNTTTYTSQAIMQGGPTNIQPVQPIRSTGIQSNVIYQQQPQPQPQYQYQQ